MIWNQNPSELTGSLFLLAGLPGLLVFVLFYAWRSPWRSNLGGRVIMQLAATEAAVLILAGGQAIWGTEWPGRDWIRLAIYFAMFMAFWRLAYTVIKVQSLPPIAPARPPEQNRAIQLEDAELEADEETQASRDDRGAGLPDYREQLSKADSPDVPPRTPGAAISGGD